MESVTIPSIAYIATQVRNMPSILLNPSADEYTSLALQVRFALSSQAVFSRTDQITDSEFFYNLVIELLEDPEEHVEVADLLKWWNQ